MLFKKSILCFIVLGAALPAHAMRRTSFDSYEVATPVYRKKPQGHVRKPLQEHNHKPRALQEEDKVIPMHASEMQRLWGLFEQNAEDDKRIDVEASRVVFERVVAGMVDEEQREILSFFLANAMNSEMDFSTWLLNIEQISDGTPKGKITVFRAIVEAKEPY
jgi:hypothetical protein